MIPMDFDWLANVLTTDYQGDNQHVLNINTDTRTCLLYTSPSPRDS